MKTFFFGDGSPLIEITSCVDGSTREVTESFVNVGALHGHRVHFCGLVRIPGSADREEINLFILPYGMSVDSSSNEALNGAAALFRAFERYFSDERSSVAERDPSENEIQQLRLQGEKFRSLRVMREILVDFVNHGYFRSHVERITRGFENVDWKLTFTSVRPLIQDSEVFYPTARSRKRSNTFENFIAALQKRVLSEIIQDFSWYFIEVSTLPSKFSVPREVSLMSRSEVLFRLNRERNRQFNQRSLHLISLLTEYFSLTQGFDSSDGGTYEVWGVQKFSPIWETMLRRQAVRPSDMNRVVDFTDEINLKMPRARWMTSSLATTARSGRMIVDLLLLDLSNLCMPGKTRSKAYLLDAKYYNFDKESLPGIEDVRKQVVYEQILPQALFDARPLLSKRLAAFDRGEEKVSFELSNALLFPSAMQNEDVAKKIVFSQDVVQNLNGWASPSWFYNSSIQVMHVDTFRICYEYGLYRSSSYLLSLIRNES